MSLMSLLRQQNRKSTLLTFGLKIFNTHVVSRKQLLNGEYNATIHYFGLKDHLPAGLPKFSGNLPKSIKNNSVEFFGEHPFVAEIKDVIILGDNATVFDSRRNIIAEANSIPLGNLEPRLHHLCNFKDIYEIQHAKPSHTLDLACSLVSVQNKTYYHWILDTLTRIEGLDFFYEKTRKMPTLIINSNLSEWQVEFLDALGFKYNEMFKWNGDPLAVNNLLISSARQSGNRISPNAIHWLRNKIIQNIELKITEKDRLAEFSKRIYISRKKAADRKVANENDVLNLLESYGFKAYCLEDLSLAEKVRLFSNAEIVIGNYGSGLTNLIFSQQQSKVIEFVFYHAGSHYFLISKSLGLDHFCLECKHGNLLGLSNIKRRSDTIVDVNSLSQVLKNIL